MRVRRYPAPHVVDVPAAQLGDGVVDRLLRHPDVTGGVERDGWLRLEFADRQAARSFCHAAARDGVATYDGLVDPVLRFLVEHGVRPARPRIGYLDIETDSRVPFSRKEQARVLCWVVVDQDGVEQRGLLDRDTDDDEARLFAELWRALDEFDCVAAWNGDRFDFPVIKSRTVQLGVPVGQDMRRWLWLDHLECFRRANVMAAESGEEKQSFALDAVAHAVLGVGKLDFDASKTWQEWAAGGERRQRLFNYCAQDTRLMPALEAKTGYIELLWTLAEATGVFADTRGINPQQQVDSFLARLARERGHRFPTRLGRPQQTKYRGAYVMEPRARGIARGVHVADFSSMYPSIILSWNLSPETLTKDAGPDTALSPLTGSRFRQEPRGVLPQAIEELLRLRAEWSKRKAAASPGTDAWREADRRSTAYKIAANSFYGVVGAPTSRHFNRAVAEAVSQCGVFLIKETIAAAEKLGYDVVYADTDSCLVTGVGEADFQAFVDRCNAELYPRLLRELGCADNRVSLAYEKAYERIVFVSAKRYCNPPEAPIWMADGSFRRLGDVRVGDRVFGWIDGRRMPGRRRKVVRADGEKIRRLCESEVVAVHRYRAPIVKVEFESGRMLRCTADHRWKFHGRTGTYSDYVTPAVGRILSHVISPPVKLTRAQQREADWLGGIWDGEGSLASDNRGQISISQSRVKNPEVCARIETAIRSLGWSFGRGSSNGCERYVIHGSLQERVEFLTWCRPAKGARLARSLLKSRFARPDRIVKVESDGMGDVVGLTTTTGNYVAWGFASKNCASWRHYKGTAATADSKPEVKGLEFKRGDSVRLARRLQEEVAYMLVGFGRELSEEPADYAALLDRWRRRVLDEPLELDDVRISKRLSRPLDKYVVREKQDGTAAREPAHVRVGRLLADRGRDVGEGAKVDYFVSKAGKHVEVEPAEDWAGECDRATLWERYVAPPAVRLVAAAFPEGDWKPHAKADPEAKRAIRGSMATKKRSQAGANKPAVAESSAPAAATDDPFELPGASARADADHTRTGGDASDTAPAPTNGATKRRRRRSTAVGATGGDTAPASAPAPETPSEAPQSPPDPFGSASDERGDSMRLPKPPDMRRGFETVVRRVFDEGLDVDKTYAEVEKALSLGGKLTPDSLQKASERSEQVAHRAFLLSVVAKVEVDAYLRETEQAMAAAREYAVGQLEQERRAKVRTKTITDADVLARIAQLYPDEYAAVAERRGKAEGMLKAVDNLAKLARSRSHTLSGLLGQKAARL